MDDEYRAFLESAWNSSPGDDGLNDAGAIVNGTDGFDKGAANVITEVVEIEADDEDLDEEAEDAQEAVDPPEAHAEASAEDGSTAAAPAGGPARPGAKRLGASAKVAGAPPPSAAALSPQTMKLAALAGTWKDTLGITMQIARPPPVAGGTAGACSLDVMVIKKGGQVAPQRAKVTQNKDGSISIGALTLKAGESSQDRLVWEGKAKKAVWQRQSPASPRPAAAAPKPAGITAGAQVARAKAAVQPCGAAGAQRMNGAAPGVVGEPTPASASTAVAEGPPNSDGVRSLGARAKVKPSRPAGLDSAADVEAQPDAGADPAAAIELTTFLGSWKDSMGNAVKVDWASPTFGTPGGRRQLDVQLCGASRRMVQLKITQLESGLFVCGHYNLALAKSSALRVVWADKANAARESIWQRPDGAAGGQAAPGLKRSWSADGASSPAGKLARTGAGPPPGPGLLLRQGSFNWAPPPAGSAPPAARPSGPPIGPPRPLAAALRDVPPDAKDAEGRLYDLRSVVVNFADVAAGYARSVLAKSPQHGQHDFDWEGVRRCVRYMRAEREMQIFGVLPEDFQAQDSGSGHRCGLPFDVQLMCECVEEALPEPHSGEQGAAREMTVERAYERNCLYVDSGHGAAPLACHAKCRAWLERCRDLLHLRYFYDSTLGTFDVFDGNVGPPTLARMNSFS